MAQLHICMCHRTVTWTSDVTYVCTIGLKGLKPIASSGAPSNFVESLAPCISV